MVYRRLLISGKVQGVSFRFHTCELATRLKLLGYVRNLESGDVEILVAGLQKDVEQLISWTRKGPPGAIVKDIKISELKDELPTEPFYIRRNGGTP